MHSKIVIPFMLHFLITVNATSMEIINLPKNQELIMLATGESLMQTGHYKIFHIINLESFWPMIKNASLILDEISKTSSFMETTEILKSKLKDVQILYENLVPRKREKRGIFNFLGTGIKQITGNMDNTDFMQITQELNKLSYNNKELIEENNRQAKINSKFENSIKQIVKTINLQQEMMFKNLNYNSLDKTYTKEIRIVKEIFNLGNNIDLIKICLEKYSESIHLAKLKIISKHLLDNKELNFALEKLEESGIHLLNFEQVYDFLEIKAFFNQSRLIFIIEIPQVQQEKFNTYILEALPLNDKIIALPASQVISNKENTYYITKPCKSIETYTLCNKDELLDITADLCVPNIINERAGNCSFRHYQGKDQAKVLTNSHILVSSKGHSIINSTCGTTARNITGTFLIVFHNCTVVVNKTKFTNIEMIRYEKPFIVPLHGIQISEKDFEKPILLEEIQMINRRHLKDLSSYQTQHTIANYGISVFSLLIGVTVVVYLMIKSQICLKWNLLSKSNNKDTTPEVITQPNASIEPGRFTLRRGELCVPQPVARSPA